MADKLINIEIVTPQKSVFSGKAVSITLPGSESPFQVLYNHAPIVSTLDPGIIKISDEENRNLYFASSSGFTEISNNNISVLVESAVESNDINLNNELESLNKLKGELKTATGKQAEEIKFKILTTEIKLKAVQKLKSN